MTPTVVAAADVDAVPNALSPQKSAASKEQVKKPKQKNLVTNLKKLTELYVVSEDATTPAILCKFE